MTARYPLVLNGTTIQELQSGDTIAGVTVDLTSQVTGTLPVANGGTGVTTSSGASSVVLRDANANITYNNSIPGYATTTTSDGTTTLTVASAYDQRFTGTSAQTVKLPDATTMSQGQGFIIDNDSSSNLSLQDGSGGSLGSIVPGMAGYIFCESNSTTAGNWSGYMFVPGGGPSGQVTWGTAGLSMGGGTITNSVWNGTAIGISYGGTNGTATPTSGAVAYGTGSAYAFTAAGTTGQVLTSNGSGAPTWSKPTAYATVTDDTSTNATRYLLFANQTTGNLTTEYTSSTKLQLT